MCKVCCLLQRRSVEADCSIVYQSLRNTIRIAGNKLHKHSIFLLLTRMETTGMKTCDGVAVKKTYDEVAVKKNKQNIIWLSIAFSFIYFGKNALFTS